jgi:radical SAM family protein
VETDPRRNPALLKLDLYCRGMRLDDSCYLMEDGGRQILRTRAGLGSGLELILPGGLWTNVPVTEEFTKTSPYVLYREQGQYLLRRHAEGSHANGGSLQVVSSHREEPIPVKLAPRPRWYERSTSNGKPMTRIGTLQGTYLGVYPAKVCEYWTEKPKANCHFCSVGLNLGLDDADEKSVDEVMEVVRAAREDSGITYVDFNTGHYEGDTYLDILEPFVRRVKNETGLLVGVQTPPHHDLKRYDALRDIGVNRVSFCFEIFDQEIFKRSARARTGSTACSATSRRWSIAPSCHAPGWARSPGFPTARSSRGWSPPLRLSRPSTGSRPWGPSRPSACSARCRGPIWKKRRRRRRRI